MKNAIIVVLALSVGVISFLFFSGRDSKNDSSNNSNPTSSTITENDESKATSGKTIDLSNQNLDKVSKDLLDNPGVATLDVSDNNLTGSLPAEIRKLTNLEILVASNNKMTGIPAEIGQLSKLRIANFANNDISGLPLEIGKLNNLETLDLRGNPNVSKYDISQIQARIPDTKILTD